MARNHATRIQAETHSKGVNEGMIERYLQGFEGLDEETCRAVEQHLKRDAAARAKVIALLYFYERASGAGSASA